MSEVRDAAERGDVTALERLLAAQPALANAKDAVRARVRARAGVCMYVHARTRVWLLLGLVRGHPFGWGCVRGCAGARVRTCGCVQARGCSGRLRSCVGVWKLV